MIIFHNIHPHQPMKQRGILSNRRKFNIVSIKYKLKMLLVHYYSPKPKLAGIEMSCFLPKDFSSEKENANTSAKRYTVAGKGHGNIFF
jgi:hypothetical protein